MLHRLFDTTSQHTQLSFVLTKKWRNLPLRLGCATPYLNSTIENSCMQENDLGVLDEANVLGVLTEAATAQVEAVLADDSVGVVAHAAVAAASRVVLRVGVVSIRHLRKDGCQGKQGAQARQEHGGAFAN